MIKNKIKFTVLFLCILLLFAACQAPATASSAPSSSVLSGVSSQSTGTSLPESTSTSSTLCFFQQLAKEKVAALGLAGNETPIETVQAAFRYVVANTHYLAYDNPTFTDSWRFFDTCNTAPTTIQVMGFSPLYYGWGSCENYAAALMVLLEELGFETAYVTGQTFSIDGALVDHAWIMVKIGENWYHADPQLEDNIIKGNTILYRYFLKSDDEFAAHHVWGSRLKTPDPYSLTLPLCKHSAPAFSPQFIEKSPPQSMNKILASIQYLEETIKNPSSLKVDPLPPFPSIYEQQAANST